MSVYYHFKITCDWACENRACGHTNFDHFFRLFSCITLYFIMLWPWNFQSLFTAYLSGFMVKVTECKYCNPLLGYSSFCDMTYLVPICPKYFCRLGHILKCCFILDHYLNYTNMLTTFWQNNSRYSNKTVRTFIKLSQSIRSCVQYHQLCDDNGVIIALIWWSNCMDGCY